MSYRRLSPRGVFLGVPALFGACSYDWSVHQRDAGSDGGSEWTGSADAGMGLSDAASASEDADTADESDAGAGPGCDESANASCTAGADVQCATTCGTLGRGTCTASCAAPEPANCAPPPEVCNLADDDCDGVIDPEGLAPRAPATRAWGAPTTETDPVTQVWTVARPGGGAWMFFSVPGSALGTYASLLNEDGSPNGPARAVASLSNDASMAVTVSDNLVAVLSVDASTTDFHIRLLRADDLLPIDELAMSPTAPCSFVRAVDIAAREHAGTQKLAWIGHVFTYPKDSSGACDYTSPGGTGSFALWVAQRDRMGLWSTVKRGMSVGDANSLTVGFAAVRPWLCGEGWAVVRRSDELGVSLTHADESGVAQSVLAGIPGEAAPASTSSVSIPSGDCLGDGEALQAVFLDQAGLQAVVDYLHIADHPTAPLLSARSTLRTWQRSSDATSSQAKSTDISVPGLPLALTRWGGAARVLSLSPRKTLRFQSVVDAASSESSDFAVAEDLDGGLLVQSAALINALGGAPTWSLAHAGQAFVLGRSRVSRSMAGSLDSFRADGDANPPCAVTHALACVR